MTELERDAIHDHILKLKNVDRPLSESLLNAMQEREMLLRWVKHSLDVPREPERRIPREPTRLTQ